MQFHLGRPILVMILLSALSGLAIELRTASPKADLTLWVFADAHAQEYQPLVRQFTRETGRSVEVDLITSAALNARLTSLFMSPETARELPDAAEIELGSVARFFRPPVEQIGFLPLNHYLETHGLREIRSLDDPGEPGWNARLISDGRIYTYDGHRWAYNPRRKRPDALIDRILSSRLAVWSKDGQIFGMPHDVHPVAIAYRADLFSEAGVDLESCKTWDSFRDACLRFQAYWRSRGFRYRHAMALSDSGCDELVQMLLQRHVNLIDAGDRVRINDPVVARTLAYYARMAAGPDRIGAPTSWNGELWAEDLSQGNVCAMLTPDWRAHDIKQYASGCRGKLRLMPLPRFNPTDAPTSTWGGTMIGIPRRCRNPDRAWALIQALYLSPEGVRARFSRAGILPPIPEEWDNPIYHRSDPFFGGQKSMDLYIRLARQVPTYHVTPATPLAIAELSLAVNRATSYINLYGSAGLEQACQHWLDLAAADLSRRIDQAAFDPIDRHEFDSAQ